MGTKSNPSDDRERQGVFIAGRIIAELGHIFRDQPINDVGIDAHVELVDEKSREATGQLVGLQIKAGPSYFRETTKDAVIFRGDQNHLDYWLNHSLPVVLVLVDTVKQRAFWQEISQTTIESLGKGWKVSVPFTNDLATNFVAAARHLVGLDANAFSYTRLALNDTSSVSANAKRYAANILMRPPVTRLRAEAVVRRATADIRKERYSLDGFKKLFGDRDADVVSLFVAGDLHDEAKANWYCRTMWVSKDLDAGVRPAKIGGENLGDGLEIVWEANYVKAIEFYHGNQIGKQEFLTNVKSFTANTEALIINAFKQGLQIACTIENLVKFAASLRELYIESNNVGLPPYECEDVAQRFQDVMALADNAFIYALKINEEPHSGGWPYLLEKELNNFHKNLGHLQYELEKIK